MSATSTQEHLPEKLIEPDKRWVRVSFEEIWAARELVILLSWSGFTVRFKQMALGMFWAALEPLSQLLVMIFVFSFLLKVPSGGVPYPLLIITGLIPWTVFMRATTGSMDSLVENMHVISKVYFPRIVLPISNGLREFYGAVPMLLVMVLLIAYYDVPITFRILVLPMAILFAMIFAIGIGLWLSALVVQYRDVRHILGIILQMGIYLTPVVYSPEIVPEAIRPAYELNPMFWVVGFSRWSMLESDLHLTPSFYVSAFLVVGLLVSGFFVFSKLERNCVDVS